MRRETVSSKSLKNNLQGKLIEYFKIINGSTNVNESILFSFNKALRTRSISKKLRWTELQQTGIELFTRDIVKEQDKFHLP